MTKNIILGITGFLVLILSIIGITKYKKNNSIDVGIGIGNTGIGTGEYKSSGGGFNIGGGSSSGGKTKKGQFLKCTQYRDEITSTFYVEFRNNKFYKMVQYKIDATVPADYMNEHTKKEIEGELARYFICANDQDYALCGNLKFKWNNRNITMTFGVDMSPLRKEATENNKDFYNMSRDEFIEYIKKENSKTQCEKVSKAPIYAAKADAKGTYYKKYKESIDEYNKKNEIRATKNIETTNSYREDVDSCTNSQLIFKTESAKYNEYKNGLTYIITSVKNTSSKDCKLGNFQMDIKDTAGGTISIEKGYASEVIKAGDTVTIKNSIGFDITGRYSKIDYIID